MSQQIKRDLGGGHGRMSSFVAVQPPYMNSCSCILSEVPKCVKGSLVTRPCATGFNKDILARRLCISSNSIGVRPILMAM